jgi:hypothetical protein
MESRLLYHAVIGAGFLVAAIAAGPLVRTNLWVYRKLGLGGFARAWEGRLGWWVPTVRVLCVTLGVAVVVAGLVAIGEP